MTDAPRPRTKLPPGFFRMEKVTTAGDPGWRERRKREDAEREARFREFDSRGER